MRILLVLVALVACTQCVKGKDYRAEFAKAMEKFAVQDKINTLQTESPAMVKIRLKAFTKYAKLVDSVNNDKTIPFTAENNFLSVLTRKERKAYRGFNCSGHENAVQQAQERLVLRSNHPPSRDFSNKISDVKDQGRCGSCWTFAATAALEGEIYFKNSKDKVSLSEQEYMECSTTRDGCQGGWMEDCYTYSKRTGRIAPTEDAPYRARDFRQCNIYGSKANALSINGVRVTGNINIRGDDQLLHYAVSHIVSVAVKASPKFQMYKSGVMVDSTCNVQPDHAVAVVGYGIEDDRKYWKVRNSWGTGWGDQGYIKMDREKPNMCMISTYSHIPAVECTSSSNCNPADPDGGSDGGDDSDDGGDDGSDDGDRSPKLCWKKVGLGKCLASEVAATSVCDEVGKDNCAVIRLRRCWYGANTSANVRAKAYMWLNMPCGEEDSADEGESVDGECDANAGLVLCRDCNCCKHVHMCDDPA